MNDGYVVLRSELHGMLTVVLDRGTLPEATRQGWPTYAPSELKKLGGVKEHVGMITCVSAAKRIMRDGLRDARVTEAGVMDKTDAARCRHVKNDLLARWYGAHGELTCARCFGEGAQVGSDNEC